MALSETSAAALAANFGVRTASTTVIPNAVDHHRFLPPTPPERQAAQEALGVAEGGPVVAYVGALAVEKGVTDLVEAADPSWHLVLAGSGPLRAALERAASARGLRRRSWVPSTIPWASTTPLTCWCSRAGASNSRRSSSRPPCAGCRWSSTSVGGVPDLVDDGRTGLLVPARSPRALAEAIGALAGDEARRASMGAAGRDAALQRFTFDATVDQWLDVLHSVAERPTR